MLYRWIIMVVCAKLCLQLGAAPVIQINGVTQQFPWNNAVDIDYQVVGVTNDEYEAIFEVRHNGSIIGIVTNALDGTGRSATSSIAKVAKWSAPTMPTTLQNVEVTPIIVQHSTGDDYLIIDLETWSVRREGMKSQSNANLKYNTNEYKTKKMVFRKVPAGSYMIGVDHGSSYWSYGRRNWAHTVSLPSDYYVAIFRLTIGQYSRIVGDTASSALTNKTIKLLSWNDIRGNANITQSPSSGIIATIQAHTNLKVDIPTHAMCEVAHMANSTAKFADGTDTGVNNAQYIWCSSNSGGTYLHDVGSLLPNAWGFYDVSGLYGIWFRDGNCSNVSTETGPFVSTYEPTLGNGFTPISIYSTYRYYSYVDYNIGASDVRASGRVVYTAEPTIAQSHRLAVYPTNYYPNGGN